VDAPEPLVARAYLRALALLVDLLVWIALDP
jgi:hypothetical protein